MGTARPAFIAVDSTGSQRRELLADLVEAKLRPPVGRRRPVERVAAREALAGIADARIVAVIAPAGYGKTSLASALAADVPTVWLTADPGDDDPVVLLRYLAAAAERVGTLEHDVFDLLSLREVPARAVLARILRAIETAGTSRLIIDDVDRISSRESLDVVAELVDNLPPGCTAILLGRDPTCLPLVRWTAQGRVLQLGAEELAMGPEDAGHLMREYGVTLSDDELRRLVEATDGWPAILALAAQRAQRDPGWRPSMSAQSTDVAAYLREELLDRRSADEVAFLTRLSVLERLDAPLCEAVTGVGGCGPRLDALRRSTLLVNDHAGQYRFHAILRSFLGDELKVREPDLVSELHRRAAEWLFANDRVEEAVDHAVAAGLEDWAVDMFSHVFVAYHWSGRRATIRRWLAMVDDGAFTTRPWLAVQAAWQALSAGDVPSTERYANLAERAAFVGAPSDGTASFESGRAMLRVAIGRAGVDDMLANARLAVDAEPAESPWREMALWMLALATLAAGDRAACDRILGDTATVARSHGNVGMASTILGHRALLAVERGDWPAADGLIRQAAGIANADAVTSYMATAPMLAARARLAARRGAVPDARHILVSAVALRPVLTAASPVFAVHSLTALARAHLAVSDVAGARTLATQARQVVVRRPALGAALTELEDLDRALAAMPATLAVGASSLTAAELRVLALLPYYLSFKEIGQRLDVKATTVKTHAVSVYGKLGASSRGEAVDIAIEFGLLEAIRP